MIALLMCLCLLQTHFVNSGVIFDKISSGFAQGKQRLSCGLQLINKKFISHQDNPCYGYQTNDNKVESTRIDVSTSTQFVGSTTSIAPTKANSTEKTRTYPTVPGGRNFIKPGANCSAGQRGDGKGVCREEDTIK